MKPFCWQQRNWVAQEISQRTFIQYSISGGQTGLNNYWHETGERTGNIMKDVAL